jgi:hypothetical protein
MRAPDLMKDGWCLNDGEALQRQAPKTFLFRIWRYEKSCNPAISPSPYLKSRYKMSACPSVERMWVVIRERTASGYIGMLNNEPDSIPENDRLWLGTELRFEFRHIIAVDHGNEESITLARAPVPIPWDRSN